MQGIDLTGKQFADLTVIALVAGYAGDLIPHSRSV